MCSLGEGLTSKAEMQDFANQLFEEGMTPSEIESYFLQAYGVKISPIEE